MKYTNKEQLKFYTDKLKELWNELSEMDQNKDPINFHRKVMEAVKLIEITEFKSWKQLEELLKNKGED